MKGSIHSDQTCPICGSRFKSVEPKGLFCPDHPGQSPHKFVVRYGKITKRFDNYPAALQFLTGLRFQEGSGQFDPRDYQVKAKPLSFDRLADEWLELKVIQVRSGSMPPLRNAMRRATNIWGSANIKSIKYSQVEDLMKSLDLSAKTKKNTLDALKQFWAWVADRYDIPPLKKWPRLGTPEMKFRKTVSIADQEAILAEVYKIASPTRIRSWIGIKWLCTYISVRPGEMLNLKEGDIDRRRGLLIFPHPKERRPKVVPLLDEDRELLSTLPLAFPDMPFFRHEINADKKDAGKKFGPNRFYRDWKAACSVLGLEGVDLYGGTKHSTAMGLRDVATYEEVRKMTGHTTNKAFDRYLQLEGENMKSLFARRQSIADNELITSEIKPCERKVLNFKG
ncbi:hypothetical protein C4J81_17295 [Deltaproteobacteria bacterium Smac51]|nr:hypothetical protein C4J81_17295 [Deltaproteobacteria bacterium Smac51]